MVDAIVSEVVSYAIGAAVFGIIVPGLTWLVTLLPGPIRTALQSYNHGKDRSVLLGALTTIAQNAATAYINGKISKNAAITEMAGYARYTYPDLLNKLQPKEGVLEKMAEAKLNEILNNMSKPEVTVASPTPSAPVE